MFADMQQTRLRLFTGEGMDGRGPMGMTPKVTAAQAMARNALRSKNEIGLRWLGLSQQEAKSAIAAYNPEFTGPQHVNPNQVGAGGMTSRNQATAPPRRRQGQADDGTMLTGQDVLGAGSLLGG